MGLHSPCKLAKNKKCPYESETVPGTCGYHRCVVERGEPWYAQRSYEKIDVNALYDDDDEEY